MRNLFTIALTVLGLAVAGISAERPRELSRKELTALLASAATPQQHLRLAAHFEAKTLRYEADAEDHASSAKAYRAKPTASEIKRPMAPDTAAHCDYLVESLTKAAKEARALANAHAAMAK
jgi:hypothetical protein